MFLPVENCSAGNSEGHHHDQVGQEGEGAEDQMGSSSKPGLYNLKQKTHFNGCFGLAKDSDEDSKFEEVEMEMFFAQYLIVLVDTIWQFILFRSIKQHFFLLICQKKVKNFYCKTCHIDVYLANCVKLVSLLSL